MMSGTSLDGVDMALCEFHGDGRECTLLATRTVPYSPWWRRRLSALVGSSAEEYVLADVELGRMLGCLAADFLRETGLRVDAVSSHGHTVFHQPDKGVTTQIGDGDAIAAATGLPVVWRFRQLDVALGGQGAPLVPLGDRLLFGNYDACLNLGGIANVSGLYGNVSIAYDICPCNQLLNRLAERVGCLYDPQGEYARKGCVDEPLLCKLEALDYYRRPAPKSLGKEWVDSQVWPLLAESSSPVNDLLATVVHHIVCRVSDALASFQIPKPAPHRLLLTGGGARNLFLVETLRTVLSEWELVVPDNRTVDFKEAVVFALLGYLRLSGQVNIWRSVTGARCDSIGGNVSGLLPNSWGVQEIQKDNALLI